MWSTITYYYYYFKVIHLKKIKIGPNNIIIFYKYNNKIEILL